MANKDLWIGDSIGGLVDEDAFYTELGVSTAYANKSQGGTYCIHIAVGDVSQSAPAVPGLQTNITAEAPLTRIIVTDGGVNDITLLNNYSLWQSLYWKRKLIDIAVANGITDLIFGELVPAIGYGTTPDPATVAERVKILNYMLTKMLIDHASDATLKIAYNYHRFLHATSDDLLAAYADGDGVHLKNPEGYTFLGQTMAHFVTPVYNFTVAATGTYPDRGNWDHWILGGSAHLDAGCPHLVINDTIDSPVWYLGTLTLPTIAGIAWSYRRSASNFLRGAAGSFTAYSGKVDDGKNQFTQIRATATSEVNLTTVLITNEDRTTAVYQKGAW